MSKLDQIISLRRQKYKERIDFIKVIIDFIDEIHDEEKEIMMIIPPHYQEIYHFDDFLALGNEEGKIMIYYKFNFSNHKCDVISGTFSIDFEKNSVDFQKLEGICENIKNVYNYSILFRRN